jgi:RNA polymerase sigma factor (sigma-70 family)
MTASVTSSSGGSLSLGELRKLACVDRCQRILVWQRNELHAAIRALLAVDPALKGSVSVERLAWAVAFNVDGAELARTASTGIRCYTDRWPHETSWTTVWATLAKPVLHQDSGESGFTLLSELACSVACEHRDDWQHAEARPVAVAEANRAFEVVYQMNNPKVVGDVFRHFGHRAGEPEAIAAEAWARVFCDYWSMTARRRFLGLSRISTLVCQVSRYVAIDALRERARTSGEPPTLDDLSAQSSALRQDLGISNDPTLRLFGAQLEVHVKTCMKMLPARQRVVAEMVWFREIRSKRVAEVLGISEPAVSQHLKKARESVASCLQRANGA